MDKRAKLLFKLFTSAFFISAATFGSGYVIVSVIKKRFVDELKWIDEDEMINLIALAQSSPGVMTANTALLVGYKTCGAIGAFLAVLGVAIPPLMIMFVISFFYNELRDNAIVSAVLKGMQAGASAVIADVVVSMFISVIKDKGLPKIVKITIMVIAFTAAYVFNINFILIVLSSILLGLIWFLMSRINRRRKADQLK